MSSAPKWPAAVLRFFGVVHLLFVAYGLYLVIWMAFHLVSSGRLERLNRPETPYYLEFYLARTAINLFLLAALGYAGVLLVRGRRTGVRISNVAYSAMLVYFLASILAGGISPLRISSAMSESLADGAVHVQLFTGYPIVALVALNLARRKLPEPEPG